MVSLILHLFFEIDCGNLEARDQIFLLQSVKSIYHLVIFHF